ncbi:MAG: hypothetical protein FJX75_26505 [Armatimonadetes bacterium]|nr:hypothetical protein [Armatimonadota bacterium]
MSRTLDGYHDLLRRAVHATALGATLSADTVYYSARDPLRRRELSKADADKHGGRRWEGKITRGECVDADDILAQRPAGLSGQVILYRCTQEPSDSAVFRRTKAHRGSHGLLRGHVVCRIAAPYYVNPAPMRPGDRTR